MNHRGFLALAVFCACAHAPPVPSGPPPDAATLLARVEKAHALPDTLSCDARASVDAPERGGRYSLHVLVKRPASIRIEAILPTGDPGAVLVAERGRFALLDLRNNVFYRGPATPRNLSRLLPVPFAPDELVSLLTGAMPALPFVEGISSARDGNALVLRFAGRDLAQEVALGQDLRLLRVRRTTARGDLLWEVTLDEHEDDSGGAQVPKLLHLDAPGARTRVDLRLRNLVSNRPPAAGAFVLNPPKGTRIEEVD